MGLKQNKIEIRGLDAPLSTLLCRAWSVELTCCTLVSSSFGNKAE